MSSNESEKRDAEIKIGAKNQDLNTLLLIDRMRALVSENTINEILAALEDTESSQEEPSENEPANKKPVGKQPVRGKSVLFATKLIKVEADGQNRKNHGKSD